MIIYQPVYTTDVLGLNKISAPNVYTSEKDALLFLSELKSFGVICNHWVEQLVLHEENKGD